MESLNNLIWADEEDNIYEMNGDMTTPCEMLLSCETGGGGAGCGVVASVGIGTLCVPSPSRTRCS